MRLQNKRTLTAIAWSLDHRMKFLAAIVNDPNSTDKEIGDAEEHLIQVEQILGDVEYEYELLRKTTPSMRPFAELFKNT